MKLKYVVGLVVMFEKEFRRIHHHHLLLVTRRIATTTHASDLLKVFSYPCPKYSEFLESLCRTYYRRKYTTQ